MSLTDQHAAFRAELIDAGLLWPTTSEGLYLRSEAYESVHHGVDRVITEAGSSNTPCAVHAPLLVPGSLLVRTDYVRSFPDLLGVVRSFAGGQHEFHDLLEDLEREQDWTAHLATTDLALASAACHSVYPLVIDAITAKGSYFEVFGQCYRHEPSNDPFRQQAFNMHEQVFIGSEDAAFDYWEGWIKQGQVLFGELGLVVDAVVANDPFFGRSGALLAENQREEALKIEFVLPIYSTESPTAITSVNRHRDHFGGAFGLRMESGAVAHSACVGFGADRITLALFRTHGLDADRWPSEVRGRLGL